jgi:hypothetical protein
MADDAEVAARFGLDLSLARELLLDFQGGSAGSNPVGDTRSNWL